MAEQMVLMIAEDDGRPVARAINLAGEEALYGRLPHPEAHDDPS